MKKILTAGVLALALTGVAAPAHAVTTETSDVKLSRSFSSIGADGRSFYSIDSDGTCNSLTGCDNVIPDPWRYTTG